MTYIEKRNPRFDFRYPISIIFSKDYQLKGITHFPSHYGTSMEVSQLTFEYLQKKGGLWENKELKIESPQTTTVMLTGNITHLYQANGKFYLSLRLADNLHWYSGNESSVPKYVPVQVD